MTTFFCCDDLRLQVLRRGVVSGGVKINGIDYLEVVDRDDQALADRQRTLLLHFVNPLPAGPAALTADNVVITGGVRIKGVKVLGATTGSGPQNNVLTVTLDRAGDFSTYTLELVHNDLDNTPPPGFDPVVSAIDFSFKVECPSDFDCKQQRVCPPDKPLEPNIDYLAKDYSSFRQLMLDRMAVTTPGWTERNAADIGITLVELLAYVGDQLSYRQDAIATESYLGTSRRRVSVRRHARLLDYLMSDGSNSRVWAHVRLSGDPPDDKKPPPPEVRHDNLIATLNAGTQLLTSLPTPPPRILPNSRDYDLAIASGPEVFETLHDVNLYQNHYSIGFYTWGGLECCIPKGATKATLRGHFEHLNAGDVLIFQEMKSPLTGSESDADLTHRCAVMLTDVVSAAATHGTPSSLPGATVLVDPLGGQFDDPPTNNPVPITEITWADADALPFPLCVSSITDAQHDAKSVTDVSVAIGNIVLADHGRTILGDPEKKIQLAGGRTVTLEDLGTVPAPTIFKPGDPSADRCQGAAVQEVAPRFNPVLKEGPVTQAAPYNPKRPPLSAAAAMTWSLRDLMPQVQLEGALGEIKNPWSAKRDLLSSAANAHEFVVEVESDGSASLRFGDDEYGLRPAPGTQFAATYRVGNGTSGNIGAEALGHIVSSDSGIAGVSNPMPAAGGLAPEPIEQVKQEAPSAFRVQERAVTSDDYAGVAERHPDVLKAVATIRWTGSWQTVFISVDRLGGRAVDPAFKEDVISFMDRYRMAGQDAEIEGPIEVPLEIEISVCVNADYFRSDVEGDMLKVFSNTTHPDGSRGFFHPDNFTFGHPVYLSAIYAAAQAVQGVNFVEVTTFQRLGAPDDGPLAAGVLTMERLEIARLDNDPNFPERGVLRLVMKGGR
jgi:hypothetical protein